MEGEPSAAAGPAAAPDVGLLQPAGGAAQDGENAAHRDALRATLLVSPRAALQGGGEAGNGSAAPAAADLGSSSLTGASHAAAPPAVDDLLGHAESAPAAMVAAAAAASGGFPVGGLPSPASILDVGAPLPAANTSAAAHQPSSAVGVGGLFSPAGPEALLPSDTIRATGGETGGAAAAVAGGGAGGGGASLPGGGAGAKAMGAGDLKTKLGER